LSDIRPKERGSNPCGAAGEEPATKAAIDCNLDHALSRSGAATQIVGTAKAAEGCDRENKAQARIF
jgi:hypothetical protein